MANLHERMSAKESNPSPVSTSDRPSPPAPRKPSTVASGDVSSSKSDVLDEGPSLRRRSKKTAESPLVSKMNIAIGLVVLVLLIIGFNILGKRNVSISDPISAANGYQDNSWLYASPQANSNSNPQPSPTSNEDAIKEQLNQAGIGAKDPNSSTNNTNDMPIGSDTFVSDFLGQDIPENWTASKITTVQDYVSYTKHNAMTDQGVYIYWLEGEYKGKHCKIEVPFSVFKGLDPQGIIPVNIEVVQTSDGNLLTTYFSVAVQK